MAQTGSLRTAEDVISMAEAPTRWLLTFPGTPGAHGEQDAVVVEVQAGIGPHGHPVYADAEGSVRAEIVDGGVVHLLACEGRPEPDTPVHAQPLP